VLMSTFPAAAIACNVMTLMPYLRHALELVPELKAPRKPDRVLKQFRSVAGAGLSKRTESDPL
jgi:hypothetical protein